MKDVVGSVDAEGNLLVGEGLGGRVVHGSHVDVVPVRRGRIGDFGLLDVDSWSSVLKKERKRRI